MITNKKNLLIGIVGPCSAGKSTLAAGLKKRGLYARDIAQEHSYVKDMWRRLTNPDVLIFLDVSYPVAQMRRKLNWNTREYETQENRLRDARQYADFCLDTDELNPTEVLEKVIAFMEIYNPSSISVPCRKEK